MSFPRLCRAALLAAAVLAPAAANGQALDLTRPADSLAAMRKVQCHMEDGKPAFYYWNGDVFARRQGEADVRLFRVEGMNVRACHKVTDEKRGEGFRLVSREILLYLDPATGEVLRTWKNPWTGKDHEVWHVANDPVNNSFFAVGRDGKPAAQPFFTIKDTAFISFEVPLFYPNPLAGDYQREVGGVYHATEMFNFAADLEALTDPKTGTVDDAIVGWTRISQWLPWMEMGGREGMLYFHTIGRRVPGFDDLSPVLKAEIAERYPEYRTAPPGDDKRPNETSWTYYKRVMEERKAKAPAAAGAPGQK